MKNTILAAAVTLCAAISLQATTEHTFTNDSDLPIYVIVSFPEGRGVSDRKHSIKPHTSHTFKTPDSLVSFHVYDETTMVGKVRNLVVYGFVSRHQTTSDKAFVTGGDTQWKFTKDGSKATLELVSGGSYKKTVTLPWA